MNLTKPLIALTLAALAAPLVGCATSNGNPHLNAFAEKAGTYDNLKARRDVEYTYEYRDNASGTSRHLHRALPLRRPAFVG